MSHQHTTNYHQSRRFYLNTAAKADTATMNHFSCAVYILYGGGGGGLWAEKATAGGIGAVDTFDSVEFFLFSGECPQCRWGHVHTDGR